MEEMVLTPEQVAQILQIHPFTVLKFIKKGKLKASKLGRMYRIRRSDVDVFLDEQAKESEEAMQRRLQQKAGAVKAPAEAAPKKTQPKKEKSEINTVEREVIKYYPPSDKADDADVDHYIIEIKQKT